MTNDRPITPEQAMLAVEAAGLDPDTPLNEQRQRTGDLEQQVAELSEQVKTLSRRVPRQPTPTPASANSPRTSGTRSTKT